MASAWRNDRLLSCAKNAPQHHLRLWMGRWMNGDGIWTGLVRWWYDFNGTQQPQQQKPPDRKLASKFNEPRTSSSTSSSSAVLLLLRLFLPCKTDLVGLVQNVYGFRGLPAFHSQQNNWSTTTTTAANKVIVFPWFLQSSLNWQPLQVGERVNLLFYGP